MLAKGPATISAMDIAVPPTYYLQDTYPDHLFNVFNLNHKEELKTKYKSYVAVICHLRLHVLSSRV
jgi:hypothetical protein